MDLTSRPLLDTQPDQALFGGREEELARLLKSVESGLNVLVSGERGSGKTTILRRLAFDLRQRRPDDPPPVFVEGRLADDAAELLDLIRYRFGLDPLVRQPPPLERAMWSSMPGRPAISDSLRLPRLVASLRDATKGARRVVLIDELPSAQEGHTIFGRLRDDLWQLPITWIVAVSDDEVGTLLKAPADAFFDVVLQLEPLTRAAQSRLLAARAGDEGRTLASQIDEGNPRRLVVAARYSIQDKLDPTHLARARVDRDEAVSRLGRSASMLMSELESLGPVSASDDALLKRLGWTRSRAVQVFGKLEEAGFVTSSTVKGGVGRPRKVFRVAFMPGMPDEAESRP